VDPDLLDLISLAPADQRYSFMFDGNAQELDHLLVTTGPSNAVLVNGVSYGRMNGDFPEIRRNDPDSPSRISDHDPIVGYFSLPDLDFTPPMITVPPSSTREGDTLGGAVVTYSATATDGVDGAITPVCDHPSGSLFAVGATLVTCTATDAHSNVATGTFTVTVTDTTAPTLTLPSPITAEATGPSGAAVTFTATAFDIVSGSLTPACSPASGATFPLGTTTVMCSAADAAGNPVAGSFTVTVVDTTPPSIVSVTASPSSVWPPNKQMIPVALWVTATDPVSAASCQLVSITGNDGATAADWLITGPRTASVRADRSGGGQGRTYTLTVRCTDAAGNGSSSSAIVFVPHDQGR
jgi:hypothetical protein